MATRTACRLTGCTTSTWAATSRHGSPRKTRGSSRRNTPVVVLAHEAAHWAAVALSATIRMLG